MCRGPKGDAKAKSRPTICRRTNARRAAADAPRGNREEELMALLYRNPLRLRSPQL
jgi:hypothetical protein